MAGFTTLWTECEVCRPLCLLANRCCEVLIVIVASLGVPKLSHRAFRPPGDRGMKNGNEK